MRKDLVKLKKLSSKTYLSLKKSLNQLEHYLISNNKDYFVKQVTNGKSKGLFTTEFSLNYSFEDKFFYLSFVVGISGRRSSELTKNILMFLDENNVFVTDDHYVDMEEKKLLFGEEAVIKKHEDMIKINGKFKCPICDNIFPLKFKKTSGFCIICETTKENIKWN